jgi:hypothetical protein
MNKIISDFGRIASYAFVKFSYIAFSSFPKEFVIGQSNLDENLIMIFYQIHCESICNISK